MNAAVAPGADLFRLLRSDSYPEFRCVMCCVFKCCRHVVMVPDPNMAAASTAAADEVLSSLEAFRPERWGLPAFDDGKLE